MKAYEIQEEIRALVNQYDEITAQVLSEDLELADFEKQEEQIMQQLDALEIAKEDKIIAISCVFKAYKSDALAIKEEKKRLAERQRYAEKQEERMKSMLTSLVGQGNKFSSPKTQISWRKSEQLKILDADLIPDAFIEIVRKPLNSDLKKAIKAGAKISAAVIVENQNIQIK